MTVCVLFCKKRHCICVLFFFYDLSPQLLRGATAATVEQKDDAIQLAPTLAFRATTLAVAMLPPYSQPTHNLSNFVVHIMHL